MPTHNQLFKLKGFTRFWVNEMEKDKADRHQPLKHLYSEFECHAQNMKRIGNRIMAKKKETTKAFKWNGYCNVDVPSAMSGDVANWLADEKEVFAHYNDMLVDGYQIKVYFDQKNERMCANAICHNGDSENFGHALSAFAGDWYTALGVLIFKHEVICEGDWQATANSISQPYG